MNRTEFSILNKIKQTNIYHKFSFSSVPLFHIHIFKVTRLYMHIIHENWNWDSLGSEMQPKRRRWEEMAMCSGKYGQSMLTYLNYNVLRQQISMYDECLQNSTEYLLKTFLMKTLICSMTWEGIYNRVGSICKQERNTREGMGTEVLNWLVEIVEILKTKN